MTLRRLKFVFYALGALLIVAGLALALLHSDWFGELLKRRLIAELRARTGGEVSVEALRFRPLELEVTIKGLILHGRRQENEAPLLSTRTLRARFRGRPLLRAELSLRHLEWDRAEIHIYTRPDRSSNLPAPESVVGARDSLAALFQTSIGQVTLAKTDFFWNERRTPLELQGDAISILFRREAPNLYSGNLVSQNTRLRVKGRQFPPLDLNARFELDDEAVRATRITLTCAGVRTDASLTLHPGDPSTLEANYSTSGPLPALAHSLGFGEVRGGQLESQGRMEFREGRFQAQGRAKFQNLVLVTPDFSPGRIDARGKFTASQDRLSVSDVVVSALGGEARGSGEVSFDESSPISSLRLELRGIPLQGLLRSMGNESRLPGMLRFSSRLHGSVAAQWGQGRSDLRADFNVNFGAPAQTAPGLFPLEGTARGTAAFDHGLLLRIQESSFRTEHSTLSARGTLGKRASSLEIRLATTEFEEWRPLVEYLADTGPLPVVLREPAVFAGRVSGSFERPEYAGRLEAGAFAFRQSEWDRLRADLSGSSSRMNVTSGVLEHGSSWVRFSGSVSLEGGRLDPQGPAVVNVQLERTQVAGLREALSIPQKVSGIATGRLNLAGPLNQLTGSGELIVEQGEFEGETFDSLSATLRVKEAVWHIEQIRLAKGTGRLSGYARVHPEGRTFSAELYGQDFSLAEVNRLEAMRKGARAALDGRAGFELRAGGTFEKPQGLAVWSLAEARLGETPLGWLGGRLDWQEDLLRVEGHFLGEGGTVDFTGTAHTTGDWPAQLSGRFQAFRADPWLRMLMTPRFNPQVGLSGTITLRGPLKSLEDIEVQARAEDLEIWFPQPESEDRDELAPGRRPEPGVPELAWKSEDPVDFRFHKDTLTVSRFRLRGPSTDLVVAGSLRTGQDAALALETQGTADATLLTLLDPALRASGRSDLRLRVGGTLAQPLLFGTLHIQNLNLAYADLPLRFTNLRGEIALEGERATIKSLRGTSGGGRIDVTGFVSLGTPARFDGRLELDEVRVPYPSPFTSVLDGNLRLLGTSEQGQLSGELFVRQLFAAEDFSLLRVVEEAGRKSVEPNAPVGSRLAEKIRLNILVRASPAVRLETHGDLRRLVSDVDLRVQGTLANPVEVGTIHFLSGETVFRGNRYEVVRGELNMTNPFRTERYLDLEVHTRVQRYDIWVDMSGPLDRVRLSYRSDPPLPTADLVSLLALGYVPGQEGVGTTAAGQTVQTVGASALLSEALSSRVSGRIQRIFGISRIRVDPNVGTLGPSGGARVTVEQQVTRDFTLTYVTTTASSSQQRIIQFEWILSENVAMVGVRDHNGILGFELRWRQRFK